jgi:hypothetical protein
MTSVGDLNEEIFMKIPGGYTEDQDFYTKSTIRVKKFTLSFGKAARQ